MSDLNCSVYAVTIDAVKMAGEGSVSPRVQYYFTLFCDYSAHFTLALVSLTL